jgi:hypothetical protein
VRSEGQERRSAIQSQEGPSPTQMAALACTNLQKGRHNAETVLWGHGNGCVSYVV